MRFWERLLMNKRIFLEIQHVCEGQRCMRLYPGTSTGHNDPVSQKRCWEPSQTARNDPQPANDVT